MIRKRTSSILNLDLTRLIGWSTDENQETKCKMVDSGWIKLPLEKITIDDQT
jgi:hypothetical protein